jgi:hypothetical protein
VVALVGIAAMLVTTLVLTGITSLPPLTTFLTDIALGLGIRASYKQVGGWDWNEWKWSFAGDGQDAIAAVIPIRPARADEAFAKAA